MNENIAHLRVHGTTSAIGSNKSNSSGIPTKTRRKKIPSQIPTNVSSPRIPAEEMDKNRFRRPFHTDYCGLIKQLPANVPSTLSKGVLTNNDENAIRKKESPGLGKVKIMLRVCTDQSPTNPSTQEYLRVDENQKHLSVFVPSLPNERNTALAPKVYAFDNVFTDKSTLEEISTASLVNVMQAVLQGADGAVFCYGQSNLGKSFVLFGRDSLKTEDVGIVPCAINWIYRCINDLKAQHKSRLFVRVSAIEVYGRSEKLKDLMVGYCEDGHSAPVSIKEDPLMGTQIQNVCEISANTAERAGYLLDAALSLRSCNRLKNTAEARRHSHLFLTLHVYQHKLERKEGGVSGGRSRLHFIDLGSCERTLVKTTNSLALSHSSLGHVIMSIVNNSKHVPFKESKLTRVLREHLGNVNCRAVMIAHVSRDVAHYSDTLSTIQMASRIHRVLKKKSKILFDGEKKAIDARSQKNKHLKCKYGDEESIGSSSGLEYTSGSELSCDTVVYVSKNGVPISDRELTDNEGPPDAVTRKLKCSGQHHIITGSPSENEEMVYNLAQAKVSKFVPDKRERRFSANNNFNNRKLTPQNSSERMRSLKQPVRINSRKPSLTNVNIQIPRQQATSKTTKQGPQRFVPTQTTSSETTTSLVKCYPSFTDCASHIDSLPKCSKAPNEAHPTKKKALNGETGILTPVKPPRHSMIKTQQQVTKKPKTSSSCTRKSSLPRPCKSAGSPRNKQLEKQLSAASSMQSSTSIVKTSQERHQGPIFSSACSLNTSQNISYSSATKTSLQPCNTEKGLNNENVSFADNKLFEPVLDSLEKSFLEFPFQNERPDPVGCAFESGTSSTPVSASSFSNPTYNDVQLLHKQFNRKDRPDSMIVNVDESPLKEETLEDDTVDVNFYCLTFTTRNPLIPMSKRKFTQQIKDNVQRKSLTETGSFCSSSVDANQGSPQNNEYQMMSSTAQKISSITSTNKNNQPEANRINECNLDRTQLPQNCTDIDFGLKKELESIFRENVIDQDLSNAKLIDAETVSKPNVDSFKSSFGEEKIFFEDSSSDIKEMPRLDCTYTSHAGRRTTSAESELNNLGSKLSQNSLHSSPHHEVCLYDSNSLAISYVNTKQSYSSSSDSASRSSTSSPSFTKRDKLLRKSDAVKRSARPVVMAKSTSKEGARLTLVKKQSGFGGQTLELLITNESDGDNSKHLNSQTLTDSHKVPKQHLSPSKSNLSGGTNSPKKSKWSGLKRFSGKKDSKETKQYEVNATPHKAKTSFVSKILPNKVRPGTSRIKQDNAKLQERLPNQSNSKKPSSNAGTSVSSSNFRVSHSLSRQSTKKKAKEKRDVPATTISYSQEKKVTVDGSRASTSTGTSRFGFSKKSKHK